MKKKSIATAVLYGFLGSACLLPLCAPTAYARNATIENSLKSREELSVFYQALVNTGVINELNSGVSYTVFAPVNDAFLEITRDKYPCFYSTQCKEEVADILRNHIVPHQEYMVDIVKQKAGVFSINDRHVVINEPRKRHYTVDGHEVLSEYVLGGGVLYKIDGVIASKQELSQFRMLKIIPVAQAEPEVERTVTQEKVYYSPAGEPDGISQTTTVTETTTSIAPATY